MIGWYSCKSALFRSCHSPLLPRHTKVSEDIRHIEYVLGREGAWAFIRSLANIPEPQWLVGYESGRREPRNAGDQ